MKAFACVCGVIFGVLLTFFLSVFFIMALYTQFWARPSCQAYGEGMKVTTEFRFWYGCFVTMPDGRVLPQHIAETVLRQEYLFKHQQIK